MFERLKQAMGLETKAAGGLADPATLALLGGLGPTAAGVSVTPSTALRCPAVFASVKVLAESVASLPVHVYRRTEDGGRERASDHPLEAVLNDAANPWTPASEFRLLMTTALALNGNCYAYANRDRDGRVVELIPLDASAVSVSRNSTTLEPIYRVTEANNQVHEYGRSEIFHVRGIGTSMLTGDSPVLAGREAIGIALAGEILAGSLMANGAQPAGMLKHPKKLAKEILDRLRVAWDSRYTGADKVGKTIILEDGMEFQQLGMTSVDAQFLEQRRFQLEEVARLWRVPLTLLGNLDRATHSNAEQLGQQFLSYCLMPILRLWQDALRLTCLSPEERRDHYVEFLVDDLARADLTARFEAYSKAINSGVLSPNEARGMENRGPYAGGETYMRPVNTAPAPTSGGNKQEAA
ncbi:Portal protein-like protein [uncultured Alphaproteobacteria bacterium]|uniref:Portal protein-like protein n=1 Tax=uncultured Alphaproteobacteria bacterium TaxID=91750 RepID=A0A212K2I5_9PROT|nr:Portal protein-like protein [uncultured Alphaproteobacteria bacterium]